MARVKLSEWKTKNLLSSDLSLTYEGVSITPSSSFKPFPTGKKFVVKVDVGVKKRFKKGLVILDTLGEKVSEATKTLFSKNYSQLIVEPFIKHSQLEERYLAMDRVKEGILFYFSQSGGIDIEENQESVMKEICVTIADVARLEETWHLPESFLVNLYKSFEKNYLSFLEINPLVIKDNQVFLLDAACEVDSVAQFFVDNRWTTEDFVTGEAKEKTQEEKAVLQIAETSQAALSLSVLNPNGSMFLLLSGGGASIVIADEAYNQGKGTEVANYGECSGNPTTEETYLYSKNLLSLLKKSKSEKKVLLIAGGVANFTDVRNTFKGIIQALSEDAEILRKESVKVFVRRGGPNQKEGLAQMEEFLKKEGLYGHVAGPEIVLTEVVTMAIEYIEQ